MGFWRRLLRGDRRLQQHPDWTRFAGPDWADRIMSLPVTDRFVTKQGRSIGRLVLPLGAERRTVYLKRHYTLPWWQGWLCALAPSRDWSPAFEEAANLEWARAHGLPVPRVAAVGQFLLPGGRLQSVLAVDELTDMLPLHEAIPLAARSLAPLPFERWKAGLIVELARLCRALHDRKYFHKDLYLCHFYVAEHDARREVADWQDRVAMIDFHRLRRHAWTGAWWQAKDLGQLLYSTLDVAGVTPRDRLRFWRTYQRGLDRPLLRWLVALRAGNYHSRNQRKPQVQKGS